MSGNERTENTIIVRGLPPIWGCPSPSPFVVKTLTWLRMAQISYELRPLTRPPSSKSKKIPYIERADGSMLSDSSTIIATLGAAREVSLDGDVPQRELSAGLAVRRMLEEHSYFIGLWDRFINAEGWERTSVDYFTSLPKVVRWLAPRLIRRRTRRNLYGQGLGRQTPARLAELAKQDMTALSRWLGQRPFALGDEPTTLDATVMAFVWAFTANPFKSVIREAIEPHINLMDYRDRMIERFWANGPEELVWTAPSSS